MHSRAMSRSAARRIAVAAALVIGLVATPGTAMATDGHFLHAVGAINAAMGGAGVAAPVSLLGTYYLNPAGLMAFEGTQVEFGFELFKPDRSVSKSFGPFGSQTFSKSDYTPVPAMAFSTRVGDNVVIGLGGLGIGGFGVDYPVDPTNPILMPRPYGFGQVFSNFSLLKFTPSIAFAASDQLWLGFSLNVDWASLSVDPMPVAAPAVDPGPDGMPYTQDDRAFYSSATATDGAFGFGFQAGLMYHLNDAISLGASYSSKQNFQEFEFQSVWANPNRPDFGAPREFSFDMDVPAVLAFGLGFDATDNLLLAADVKKIYYGSTNGFELDDPTQPFNMDGSVKAFGWEDIWVWSIGAQLGVSDAVTLRAGYNYSDNPIPDELSFFNIAAPAIVQKHVTFGFGYKFGDRVGVDVAYYHVAKNSGTGQMWKFFGPIPGTSVTNEMLEDSISMQFTFFGAKSN